MSRRAIATERRASVRLAGLRNAISAAVLALATGMGAGATAHAQNIGSNMLGTIEPNPNAQMLLEADELVYDNTNNTVAAVGNVQIAYDGYTLVAQRVTYSRATGRVIANGDVEIVEPNGSRIFAEEIDITDDFSDGFVSSLQVDAADNTRFAAESAERRDGSIAVFNNGVYTACEKCKENPDKPPLWQIRAERVIINDAKQTVEYENASFELFGKPIARLPYFRHADPAIKRKSGFLIPSPSFTETLGVGVRNSYFYAMAPNYDLTLSGTYYTNQGFLGEAEWRHRLHNGSYSIGIAGIDQQNPQDFSGPIIDTQEQERMALTTSGQFNINPRWRFGWNALFQTDGNFARTYGIERYNSRDVTNEIYLTGLAGKNYFDVRTQQFIIQDDLIDQDPRAGVQKLEDQQGNVLPIVDHNWVSSDSIYGGQVSFDTNIQSIHRDDPAINNFDGLIAPRVRERHHGISGSSLRTSTEAEWKRSDIVNGAVLTTSLSARSDVLALDTDGLNTTFNPLTSNDTLWRGMAAGMLEIRYPLVARDGFATHLFEPIAQIIARPDETHIGRFVNEDAQSLVFDATNLFERDKFSGYDRVEGGTRANVGFRYSASFDNGAVLSLVGGQSFHIAGQNSFAQRDLVNAGLESGLETDRSDYVLSANVNDGHGLSLGLGGRFDENNLSFRRGELAARYAQPTYALSSSYVYVDGQAQQGSAQRRHEFNAAASAKLSEYWRAFGSLSFDIEESNLHTHGFGIAYDDSCFSFSVAYQRTDGRYTGDATDTSVMFRIGLRTIGDYNYKYSLDDLQ